MKKETEEQNEILDTESIESLERYCNVVVSVVKRLTKERFNFSTGEHEVNKSETK